VKLSSRSTSFQTAQRTAVVAALAILVSGCSILEEDKIDYKSAAKTPTLEIPPDLSQLRRDSRYAIESLSLIHI
jgi:outer membrane protein assembly factor BamC